MFVRSYLDTAAAIIGAYDGGIPLAQFLKKYFTENKKFGSRDRKQISQLVYSLYRTGHSLKHNSLEVQLLAGLFLCSNSSQPVLHVLKPEWNAMTSDPLSEKFAALEQGVSFNATAIFSFGSFLSTQIEATAFTQSFLVQPDTFLRLRPGRAQKVLQQLDDAGIDHKVLTEQTVVVPPAAKLDERLILDRDVVIQDKSSQQVLSLLQPFREHFSQPFSAWDCCAASGGKSILLLDQFPAAKLTVSDIRPSILHNLRKRFERAGIQQYQWFVGDVSDRQFDHKKKYELVICDAPCSGSGTWGRTPEWLQFFTEKQLNHYVNLQRKIATRASQQLSPDGFFLYITCSVFRQENEEVVEMLQNECGLQLVQMQYFAGYEQKADTLFAALFRQ